MAQLFKNNAYSSLASGLAIGGTTLTVAAGHGDRFPVVSGADFCLLTLQNAANNIEIVKVTARAAGADSMTIVRAQEGTTERAWLLGDVVDMRVTASYLGFLGFLAGATAPTAAGFRSLLDVPTRTGGDASGTWGISISGNAATVTNGVYTSGAYANPGWITALAASKITGQLAVANGGTGAATLTAGSLLVGNGTGAVGAATAAQIVAAIGSTPVQNANAAATALSAGASDTAGYATTAGSPFAQTLLDDTTAAAARATLGLVIGTDVLSPNGSGANLTGFKKIAQIVRFESQSLGGFAATITLDDSIPQITEGDQLITQAFTPLNPGSTIYVRVEIPVFNRNATAQCIIAGLFLNDDTNAKAVASVNPSPAAAWDGILTISKSLPSWSGAKTLSVRMGGSAGSLFYTNGRPATLGTLGARQTTSLEIIEVLP